MKKISLEDIIEAYKKMEEKEIDFYKDVVEIDLGISAEVYINGIRFDLNIKNGEDWIEVWEFLEEDGRAYEFLEEIGEGNASNLLWKQILPEDIFEKELLEMQNLIITYNVYAGYDT